MLDLITLAAAKAISGGGSGGGVTPQQLQEALATKQNIVTAGTGIGIMDDEIRVTYGEDSYSNTPIFAGIMGTTGELVDDICYGAIMQGMILSENDTLKIIVGESPNEEVYTDVHFIDMTNGDYYQKALIDIGEQMGAEYQYAAFVNCHGIKVAVTPEVSYIVADADGNKQNERAFILTFGTASGIPIVSIIANYMPSENYTFYKKGYALLPNTALDFSVIAKKPSVTELAAPTSLTLADNTEYYLTNVSDLSISYPSGRFESWIRLTTESSGTVTIELPTSQYIGTAPTFGNGETWEISIKDGIVAAAKVGDGA